MYKLHGYPIDFELRRRRPARRDPRRFRALIARAARLSIRRGDDNLAGDGLTAGSTPPWQREA
jgi:hypothetical protein